MWLFFHRFVKFLSLLCSSGFFLSISASLVFINALQISAEDYMKNRDHIAKMRSLLFHHEMKSKRIKKIKSKTYHRLKNKDKLKAESVEMMMDPEAAKELARKQEFERAKVIISSSLIFMHILFFKQYSFICAYRKIDLKNVES